MARKNPNPTTFVTHKKGTTVTTCLECNTTVKLQEPGLRGDRKVGCACEDREWEEIENAVDAVGTAQFLVEDEIMDPRRNNIGAVGAAMVAAVRAS